MAVNSVPRPLYFGEEHSIFGWYHALPSGTTVCNKAVVIVSPNGFDMQNTHWGLRRIAQQLADEGVPVIRFDLDGTGDSLGDDRQPGRIAAWLRSIDDAIDLALSLSGCESVVLMGVRLGATLASVCAERRHEVTGLILYAPCVTGRQYVRESRALMATMRSADESHAVQLEPGDMEMAGWLLTGETVRDLEKLDISKLKYSKQDVLYIHRQELAVDTKLLNTLRTSARSVLVRESAEYSLFNQDALFSVEPSNDFECIRQWVHSLTEHLPRVESTAALSGTYASCTKGQGFVEQPVFFGRDTAMFGVLCTPEKDDHQSCIVFVSTGANHRIGSQRLHVVLARQLALQGISSFRIDVSGVGDSQVRPGRKLNEVYFLPAYEDVVQAVDAVVERGFKNVAVSGLCSGAYLAYNAAARDSRIKMLFILNLFRFIWRDTDTFASGSSIASAASLESYGQKIFRWATWRKLFRGNINVWYLWRAITTRIMEKLKSRLLVLLHHLIYPGRGGNAVKRDCITMLNWGTKLNFIFSAGDGGMDEVAFYLGNRGKVLKNYPGYAFHDVSGADHTFTTKKSRNDLLEIYVNCIRKYEQQRDGKATAEAAADPITSNQQH